MPSLPRKWSIRKTCSSSQHLVHGPVELAEPLGRGPERLLVDHPGPRRQPVLAEPLGHLAERGGRDRQVVDVLGVRPEVPLARPRARPAGCPGRPSRTRRRRTAAGWRTPPRARPPASGRTRSARRAPAPGSPRARRPRGRCRPAATSPAAARAGRAGRTPAAPSASPGRRSPRTTRRPPHRQPRPYSARPGPHANRKCGKGGLEPPRPRAPEPKSDAAACYATPACGMRYGLVRFARAPTGRHVGSSRVHAGWGDSSCTRPCATHRRCRRGRRGGGRGRRGGGGQCAAIPSPPDYRPGGRHGHRDGRGQLPHRRLGRDGHCGAAAVPDLARWA